jgi:hypothetical protein
MGARFREFEQVFAKHLGPGMKLERAGRSGVIRLVVPAFDLNAGFPPQAENTRAGLHAAKQLARWLRGHQQLIDDRVAAWGFTRPPLTDSFISYEIHRSDEPSRYQFYP